MARLESFPISEDKVREFIKINKEKWCANPDTSGGTGLGKSASNKYIYVNLSMVRMQVGWFIPKLLFAKGLEESTGAKPIAITWSDNPLLSELIESFGIEHVSLDSICKKYFGSFIMAGFKTALFTAFDGSPMGLQSMKAGGVDIGRNLYEDILRNSSLSTIRSCRNKTCMKKILHLLWASYALQSMMKDKPIEAAVIDDMAYHEGMFIRLFMASGAKVYACSNVSEHTVETDEKGEVIRHSGYAARRCRKAFDAMQEDCTARADEILEARFSGKNGREIDRAAFAGKKVLSRDELIEVYGLDSSKKTAVIMAHTFTDAVFNFGRYYFKDYYDWVEQTLKLARDIKDVNWVLKPHPSRDVYNESDDSIEDLFQKYKSDNMCILADDVSAESIKNIADVVVTIAGNAGAEFACLGIPAVIVGDAFYKGYGFTMEPASFDEYKKTLESLGNIKKLDKDAVDAAKKLFYVRNANIENPAKFTDEFAMLINSTYKEMENTIAKQYFKSNNGTDVFNDKMITVLSEYLKTHNLSEVEYFKRGKYE